MYGSMRRAKQAVSPAACREILHTAARGVLSVVDGAGNPYGVPVNFYYEEAENTLYFHSARAGHKLEAIRANRRVCFTTWDEGVRAAGDWAWTVVSVVAAGDALLLEDGETARDKLRKLGLKYYPTAEAMDALLARSGQQAQVIALPIRHLSGKRVEEK